jgi:very-short-patch-repair endonuclease
MEFLSLSNKKQRCKNLKKYIIDWDIKSRSKFQTEVKGFLKNYWSNNVVFEEFPIVGTRLTLDFYNANKKVAIEVQGRQHTGFVKFFHQNRMNFLHQLNRDEKKERFCQLNKITLVTIYENDIINRELFETQGVIL